MYFFFLSGEMNFLSEFVNHEKKNTDEKRYLKNKKNKTGFHIADRN